MIRYPSKISLPGLQLYFDKSIITKEYLLVSGGRPPSPSWLKTMAVGRTVYCIDHGADICHIANIVPSVFIGDCDSVSENAKEWLYSIGTDMNLYDTEKDETDTQLALRHLNNTPEIFTVLTGGFGGRFDHMFSLLYSFVGSHVNGCIADEREFLFFLKEEDAVEMEITLIPHSISLLPLTPVCTGVDITGAVWPLHDAVLHQLNPYAISNRLEEGKNHIRIKNGTGILAVYLCWIAP